MKQIVIILTLLFCATLSFAQELKVKSFTHDQMSLEARVGGGRKDLNGKQCALIKVMQAYVENKEKDEEGEK